MIGNQIREQVFRDTQNHYQCTTDSIAISLIQFAIKHAGKSILDFGCATGNYSLELSNRGYDVKGVDIQPEYISKAKERGVDAYLVEGKTPFEDQSFDTVLVFEVLEHLEDPDKVIKEAKRLARKNVLITVPNCENIHTLQSTGLLFEHFADLDHKNFFTQDSLKELLDTSFPHVKITTGDFIDPSALIGSNLIRFFIKAFKKFRIIKPKYSFRLFAVAEVNSNEN